MALKAEHVEHTFIPFRQHMVKRWDCTLVIIVFTKSVIVLK